MSSRSPLYRTTSMRKWASGCSGWATVMDPLIGLGRDAERSSHSESSRKDHASISIHDHGINISWYKWYTTFLWVGGTSKATDEDHYCHCYDYDYDFAGGGDGYMVATNWLVGWLQAEYVPRAFQGVTVAPPKPFSHRCFTRRFRSRSWAAFPTENSAGVLSGITWHNLQLSSHYPLSWDCVTACHHSDFAWVAMCFAIDIW